MCRVAVAGSQNTGKSTVVKDMLKHWDMYTTPTETYRDVLKKDNLPCNRETTPDTQQRIMDFLCDQIMNTSKDDMLVLDRSPYDCLAYSLYQNLKGVEGFTDEFIQTQILLAREASKFLDIIFYVPILDGYDIPIEADDLRDTDPEYRKEIDNIFSVLFQAAGPNPFFYSDDRPAVIEIFGTPEERIKMIEFYINESGTAYGEEDSLITDDIYVPDEYLGSICD